MIKSLITIFLLIFFNIPAFAQNQIVSPLEIDGCTMTDNGSWKHCCDEHDILYWVGGTFNDRKAADQRLRSCMDKSGGQYKSETYYNTVRIFGIHFWAKAWLKRDVSALTPEELETIQIELDLYNSIGRPLDFEFIKQESIMFKALSDYDKDLICQNLKPYLESDDYKNFIKKYKQVTATEPNILKCKSIM